ncbi:MAG: CopG family ribbon-helix-helix protein [Massilia sp.]
MSETTLTFVVDKDLKEQFMAVAQESDRSVEQLLRDFMRDFVGQQKDAGEYDRWFRRKVQAGLDSANAGRVVSSEKVEEEFAARMWPPIR